MKEKTNDSEALVQGAIEIITSTHRASTSAIQRRLKVSYTVAAGIMDELEQRGIIGPPKGSEPREILMDVEAAKKTKASAVAPKAATAVTDTGKTLEVTEPASKEKKGKKVRHIEREKSERNLKCILTQDEILVAARCMADAQEELHSLQNEADEWKTQHKAKEAAAESVIAAKGSMVRTGYTFRMVECETVRDYDKGKITTRRLDTSEIEQTRDMTTTESQMGLPLK